jgi:hypothetical protein
MKYIILILLLLIGANGVLAQKQQDSILVDEIRTNKKAIAGQQLKIDALTKRLINQNYQLNAQSEDIKGLYKENENLRSSIDSLNQLMVSNVQMMVSNSKELDSKIQETGNRTASQITNLDHTLDRQQFYWIIAILAILLLGGLIYWLLGKRIISSKSDMETQIRDTKASLEEESVKLDNKLVEVLESQMKLQQTSGQSQSVGSNNKIDHSLALKVADEIIRIQKNLSRMDEGTKGLKQLNSSVKRIQDNFASNGYELVDMLGKEFNDGMKVTVNFIQNEDFEEGKRLITRIIKPQVNYLGKMIQTAQIEVTEG